MMSFFVDQVAQAPVVVQCAQSVPESWVKWLMPTIVQTAISLASIGAGVLIAIWSFRASSRKEHQHWVLDQKKVEWRELFCAFTELKKEFLPIYKDKQTAKAFVEKWDGMEPQIDFIGMMPFIFIAQELIDSGFSEEWQTFRNRVLINRATMGKLIDDYTARTLYPNMEGNQNQSVSCELQSVYCGLRDEYDRIVERMRRFSENDLNIVASARDPR